MFRFSGFLIKQLIFLELTKNESEQMLKYRETIKSALFGSIVFFIVSAYIFYGYHVLLNNVYTSSWFTLLFWTVLFFLLLIYLVYGMFSSIFYTLLAIRYIRIRQKMLLDKWIKLNGLIENGKASNQATIIFYWKRFKSLNVDLINICKQIKEFSRYCSKFISIMFPFYITIQGYMGYIVIFSEMPIRQKYLFYTCVIIFNLFLFGVTHYSASIDKYNRKFVIQNRVFNFNFNQRGGFKSIPIVNMIIVSLGCFNYIKFC